MTVTAEPVPLAEVDWRAMVERVCTRKRPMSNDVARRVAQRHRDAGEPFSAYGCPFSPPGRRHWHVGHWHVGHTASLFRLQEIADAIRARAQATR